MHTDSDGRVLKLFVALQITAHCLALLADNVVVIVTNVGQQGAPTVTPAKSMAWLVGQHCWSTMTGSVAWP